MRIDQKRRDVHLRPVVYLIAQGPMRNQRPLELGLSNAPVQLPGMRINARTSQPCIIINRDVLNGRLIGVLLLNPDEAGH